jgi:hypothetical protein
MCGAAPFSAATAMAKKELIEFADDFKRDFTAKART